LIAIIAKVLTQIQGGFEFANVSCTLPLLPIVPINAPTIVISIKVGDM